MNKSESIKELATALSKFQGEVQTIKKDATNPFFKSKYAPLDTIIEGIKKPLMANGLSYSQFPTGDNELSTILMHSSGEWIQSSVKMFAKDNTPQAQGSSITYMRRYAISAILGIATDDDDDANIAQGNAKKFTAKTQIQDAKPISELEDAPF
jgi:ERF superfamily